MSDQAGFQKNYYLNELPALAEELVEMFGKFKVWVLEGTLGAGKTTLVQEVCRQMGVTTDVLSPSFSLVNEYRHKSKETIYHLDLYRLKSLEEGFEIGLFEIVDSGYFCLIEWASAIDFLPAVPFIQIHLEYIENTMRRISVKVHEN